jgi:alginate O-acetyltransferase complex protein AlgI
MLGLVLLLHFGIFRLLALFWQSLGMNAVPIMSAPLASASLGEFWGRRWNLGFRDLAHQFLFVPAQKKLGTAAASFLVFIASGLIHDLVISLPVLGGFGLPTMYFAIQGIGFALERTRCGKQFGLRQGWRGRLFMAAITAGPACWLFHRSFVLRVIIPFMQAVHAL